MSMTEVLHANIFFIITTVAVVLFTLLMCVLLFHLIKIVKAVRRIVDRVEAGSEVLADDIENLRATFNITNLIQFIMSLVPGAKPRRASTRRKRKVN